MTNSQVMNPAAAEQHSKMLRWRNRVKYSFQEGLG